MAQRKTLSQAQVDLLRWIADGCPADREVGEFFRISAGALRNRGLITTDGRRANWSASITSAGVEYLAEVDGPPPVPRQASVSLTQQLVDEVVAAGGSLLVPKRHYWSGKDTVDYAHRARLAQIHGKVPAGKYLRATSASKDELLLELVAEERTGDRPTLVDVPVPEQVARLHAVARQFRDDKSRHEISRGQLARAVRIVHAIAIECGRRGWSVAVPAESKNRYGHSDWTATKNGHLRIEIGSRNYQLRFKEKGVATRGLHESEWRYRYNHSGPYDEGATGQLALEIDPHHYSHDGRQSRFADRASWQLETRLGHLFLELQERVLEADRADEERRIAADKAAEQARIAAEIREREWHTHIIWAQEQLLEAGRAQSLATQIKAWQQATVIRAYCDAADTGHGDTTETADWVSWCRAYADQLDPLGQAPTEPPPPEPTAESLQRSCRTGGAQKDQKSDGDETRGPTGGPDHSGHTSWAVRRPLTAH